MLGMAAGFLDAALARQARCLPVIIPNLQLLAARAPAASLAALAESILLTASCPDVTHLSVKACKDALHRMLLAQHPGIQAAWPSAVQCALRLWMQHALQGLDSASTQVDARDQPTATGSPISASAPATSPAQVSSKRSKKRRLLAEGQPGAGKHMSGSRLAEDVSLGASDGSTLSGSAAKKLKAKQQAMEMASSLQTSLSIDKEISAKDLQEWTQALKATQQKSSGSDLKPTTAHALAAGVDSKKQLDAFMHLTSLLKYAKCIAQTRLPSAVSAAIASLLLQASQKLLLQTLIIWQASRSTTRGAASDPSNPEGSQPGQTAKMQIDNCGSAAPAPAAMEATAACLSALAALVACNGHAAETLAGLGSQFSGTLEAWMQSASCWIYNNLSNAIADNAAARHHAISKEACRSISQIGQAVMGTWLRSTGNTDQDADNAQAVDALIAWVITLMQQVRFATVVRAKANLPRDTNRI